METKYQTFTAVKAILGFLGGTSDKEHACQCRRHKRHRFDPWIGRIPWRVWQPTPVFLPEEFLGVILSGSVTAFVVVVVVLLLSCVGLFAAP